MKNTCAIREELLGLLNEPADFNFSKMGFQVLNDLIIAFLSTPGPANL
ncbi:MAG: hypothetical protein RLO17_15950 [Cyclobacteriaceae bacterium]